MNIVRILLMVFMVFWMVLPVYRATAVDKVTYEQIILDEGWTVTVHDKTTEDVILSQFTFDMCNKGDKLVFERVLPAGKEINNAILEYYSIHSMAEIFLDDEVIYSYGKADQHNGKLLGYGKHFISLPVGYAGKKLLIKVEVTEDDAFDGQQSLAISEGTTIMQKELSERRIDLMISLFLILFGIITMCLSMGMLVNSGNFIQTFCIAMFSFLVGCWTLCNGDLITYFITDLKAKVYTEYMTLYVIPIPFIYYFKNRVDEKEMPLFVKIYFWVILGIQVAFASTAFLCQQLGLAHYPQFLKASHILLGCSLVLLLCINAVDIKHKRKHRSSITIGFAIAIVAVVFELFKYNLSKYFVGFADNQYSSTMGIAVLIVVISMLVDFGQSISRSVYKDAKNRVLEQMAYMDELTGLANRRKCEETLESLRTEGMQFAVISLDMNFLKKVNDTLGHEMGDALLKRFADVLAEVFNLHGTVGRMGGDEFIVILPNMAWSHVDKLVKEMKDLMEYKNRENSGLTLSTAYGIATSDEVELDDDAHAVYRLADDRMYDNKRRSKHGRKD